LLISFKGEDKLSHFLNNAVKSMRKRSEKRVKHQTKYSEDVSSRKIKVKLIKPMSVKNKNKKNEGNTVIIGGMGKTNDQIYNTVMEESSNDDNHKPSFADLTVRSIEKSNIYSQKPQIKISKENIGRRCHSRNDCSYLENNEYSIIERKDEKLKYEEIKDRLTGNQTSLSIPSFKTASNKSSFVVLNSPFKNINSLSDSPIMDSSQADLIKQRMSNEIRTMFSST
jgi:hypothetical protein